MKKIFFHLLLIFALLFVGTLSFKGKPGIASEFFCWGGKCTVIITPDPNGYNTIRVGRAAPATMGPREYRYVKYYNYSWRDYLDAMASVSSEKGEKCWVNSLDPFEATCKILAVEIIYPSITKFWYKGSYNGTYYEICKTVYNYGSKDVMVPYRTLKEFCSFINATPLPSRVYIRECSAAYCKQPSSNCHEVSYESVGTDKCPENW